MHLKNIAVSRITLNGYIFQLLLKAIEASKLDSEAFFDSDDASSNSTSTSTHSDFRSFADVRSLSELADEQRRNVDGLAARKRGGGGTNRPLTDHTSLFNNRSDPVRKTPGVVDWNFSNEKLY